MKGYRSTSKDRAKGRPLSQYTSEELLDIKRHSEPKVRSETSAYVFLPVIGLFWGKNLGESTLDLTDTPSTAG